MRTRLVGAIAGLALLVGAGVVIFMVADGGDDRKASIGAEGPKPNHPKAGPKSNDDAPDNGARGNSAEAPGKVKALAAMQRKIARLAERSNDNSYASYIDATTGEIMLVTDASTAEIAEIKDLPDAADKREAEKAKVVKATTEDLWHRRDDIQPYWGGGGIAAQSGGVCSSGYAARSTGGTIFSVTAGHCFPNGTVVIVEADYFNGLTVGTGARVYGTVSNRRVPETGWPTDFELMSGQSYAGRVFTGGVTSTTSLPVVGAGDAVVGYSDYCHSGRTTGQACGHTVNSTTAQVCTMTGCKAPVIVFTGGNMTQSGDSGAPLFVTDGTQIWIRGHSIAQGGGIGYAVSWKVVSSAFGLSIVTG